MRGEGVTVSSRTVSEEDKLLFREATQGATPLTPRVSRQPLVKEPPAVKRRRVVEPVHSVQRVFDYALRFDETYALEAESVLAYCQPGVPHKRQLQLRRGQVAWQARLDLHGLHVDSARDAICSFIEQSYQQGVRCVLVIHGKGGQHGQAPMLKNCVNQWLKQLPQVLAFHSAQARDGGRGAVYVLLKRTRGP